MSRFFASLSSRLLGSLLVLFGVSVLIFVIARVIPGDPARIALGPYASDEQVQKLRVERHLDEPIQVQYWEYLKDVAHGDLGHSLYTNRPVAIDIVQFLPATIELVLMSGFLMVSIGLLSGVASAYFRGRMPDTLIRFGSLLGLSTPGFVWAVIFQLVFAYMLGLFPIEGRLTGGVVRPAEVTGLLTVDALLSGNWAAFMNAMHHLILPALALAMPSIGQTVRITRASMMDVYEKPYIEMARAFGFSPRRIAGFYALRPALIPTLTVLGMDFAAKLGTAFLVERIYGWPGLSRYGVEVILHKDLDAIIGVVLIITLAFLVVNIIVDVLVAVLDPRIRIAENAR